MELIGNLKEKVDRAKTKEEKKAIIEAAGIALTDAELDKVAGGVEGLPADADGYIACIKSTGGDLDPGEVLPIDILYHPDF